MPQKGQAGTFKAPENQAQFQALVAQRDELQGQLRALEERRFQLAAQRQSISGTLAVEVDRRVKALDGSIDQLSGRIQQANELITAGRARFSGQWELLPPPTNAEPAVPAPPSPPAFPAFPALPGVPEVPGFSTQPSGIDLGRALALEGAGFLLVGALAWVWASRRLERKLTGRTGGDPKQMVQLQQSVDAIALEVERISENQRWVSKVINEKALGQGEAKPVDVGAKAERVR